MMLKSLKRLTPLHVSLNNSVTRPSFENLRDKFLIKFMAKIDFSALLATRSHFSNVNILLTYLAICDATRDSESIGLVIIKSSTLNTVEPRPVDTPLLDLLKNIYFCRVIHNIFPVILVSMYLKWLKYEYKPDTLRMSCCSTFGQKKLSLRIIQENVQGG